MGTGVLEMKKVGEGLRGEAWNARDVGMVDLEICLRACGRASGRRRAKAIIDKNLLSDRCEGSE